MHKDLLSEIDLYLNRRIDLWDLIDEITYYSTVNFNSVKQAVLYLENKEDEDALIVEVLLWTVINSPVKDLNETTNSFYKFLKSLVSDDCSFYQSEINWLFNDKNIAIFKKHDYLFIINSLNSNTCVELPLEYCNQTLYCANCNEEISVNGILEVPSKTFYIIEKEN